jgi:hypothetical protein
MKTSVSLVTFLFVLVSTSASAQHLKAYGFKLGAIRAEQQWNYSPQSSVHASWINPIWGLDAGAFVELSVNRNLGLLTELHYVQRGRSVTALATAVANNPQGYVDLGPVEIKHRFHYLSVPVLAQLQIDNDKAAPFVALGPRIEYLLSYPGSPVFDQFNKLELGGTVAAGVQVSLGFTPGLLAEITYNFNITHSYSNENVTVNNRSLSFLVGAYF